jgi:hypothetical protein
MSQRYRQGNIANVSVYYMRTFFWTLMICCVLYMHEAYEKYI